MMDSTLIQLPDTVNKNDLFRHNKKYLSYVGLWPTEENRGWRHHLPYILIRVFIAEQLYEVFVEHLYNIYLNVDQTLLICENIVLTGLSIMVLGRVLTILLQPVEMQKLMNAQQEICDSSKIEDEYEKNIFFKTSRFLDTISRQIVTPNLIYLLVLNFSLKIFATYMNAAMSAWHPYDANTSPYFEINSVKEVIAISASWFLLFVSEAFIVSLLLHTLVQFNFLRHRLTNLRDEATKAVDARYDTEEDIEEDTDEDIEEDTERLTPLLLNMFVTPSFVQTQRKGSAVSRTSVQLRHTVQQGSRLTHALNVKTPEPDTRCNIESTSGTLRTERAFMDQRESDIKLEMDRILKMYIQQHQALLSFVPEFESAFHWSYLCNFICNVGPTGAMMLYITIAPSIDLIGLWFIAFLSVAVVNLFMHSVLAELIASESAQVKDSIFGCDWSGASTSFKRSMGIMISRSNEPSVITIAGTFPLSMKTFQQITYTCYSYYTTMTDLTNAKM